VIPRRLADELRRFARQPFSERDISASDVPPVLAADRDVKSWFLYDQDRRVIGVARTPDIRFRPRQHRYGEN
jgi:hypothetical protein